MQKNPCSQIPCVSWVVGYTNVAHPQAALFSHRQNASKTYHTMGRFIRNHSWKCRNIPSEKKQNTQLFCLGMGTGSDVTVSAEWTQLEKTKTVWAVNATVAEQTNNRTTYRNSTNRKSKGRNKSDAHTLFVQQVRPGKCHTTQCTIRERWPMISVDLQHLPVQKYNYLRRAASWFTCSACSSCLAAHRKLITHKKGKK